MSIQSDQTPRQAAAPPRPGVGVGLFVLDGAGRFALLLRKGAHGAGCWGLIGGNMEFGDSPQKTAVDEAEQETGLVLDPAEIALGPYTNDVFREEGKHYVTLFASTRLPAGQEPRIGEPHKCEGIGWFDFDRLPEPLFLPVRNFLDQPLRPHFAR